MHFFRDKLREAVDNGDFELLRHIDDIGIVRFNFDGFTGSMWREGEVLMNAIQPEGFDAFDSERISKVEVVAHRRAIELYRFLKKYILGFEESYITNTGVQTIPRHIRMIEAEYSLTHETLERKKEYDDVVYLCRIFQVPFQSWCRNESITCSWPASALMAQFLYEVFQPLWLWPGGGDCGSLIGSARDQSETS